MESDVSHCSPPGKVELRNSGQCPVETYRVKGGGGDETSLRVRFFPSTGGGFGVLEDAQAARDSLVLYRTPEDTGYTSRLESTTVLRLEWVRNRFVAWFGVAAFFAILGALMMVVLPQVSVVAQLKEDGGYLVHVTSLNRPTLPHTIQRDGESEGSSDVPG